jgi:hypothetical protein
MATSVNLHVHLRKWWSNVTPFRIGSTRYAALPKRDTEEGMFYARSSKPFTIECSTSVRLL